MFKKIMVPVDLRHLDRLQRALGAAADLAAKWGCPVVFVSVTTEQPSELAHTPAEFDQRLQEFARTEAAERGIASAEARSYASHDPTVDLDDTLVRAVEETGADLIVIGTHKPGLADHIFSSNASYLAAHAPVSVMVVR